MNTKTVTITTRNRNLGYGSTSEPAPRGETRIKAVESPDVVGGLATVERAFDADRRRYSGGTWWNKALFVGGRRVVFNHLSLGDVIAELRTSGSCAVRLLRRRGRGRLTRSDAPSACGHGRGQGWAPECCRMRRRGCAAEGRFIMGRQARRKREWRESGHGERLRDAAFGRRTFPHTVNIQGRAVTIFDDYPLHIEYRSGRGELLAELREVRGHYLDDSTFVVRYPNLWDEIVEKTYKTERGARNFARTMAGIVDPNAPTPKRRSVYGGGN